jgi:phage terminase large subunit-like protein
VQGFPDAAEIYAHDVIEGREVAGPHVRAACRRHLSDLQRTDIYYDYAAAQRIVDFFRKRLRLADGQFDGQPFNPHISQEFILRSLFGWKRVIDGGRRFRRGYIEEGKGNGKALAIDTPIPTPDGWAYMGDLRLGDRVFDEMGHPCNVTAISGYMTDRPCYRVRFNDGTEIVADADHLWRTAALRTGLKKGPKPANAPRKGGYAIRTTAEIAHSFTIKSSRSIHPQAKWNHRIDIARPLDLPRVDLPVPPYTLGAWLGDGDTDCARLTVAYDDWEIVEAIEAEGIRCREQIKHSDTTARVALGSEGYGGNRADKLQTKLRVLGVLGRKFIPIMYLRASIDQRMILLQGLMDTDGTIAKSGQCELTLCSSGLADDAVELITSLGFKPTRNISEAKLNGRVVGHRHRIQFWAYRDRPVFRLMRKVKRLQIAPVTRSISQGRMIVGCDPISSVTVQCISVDSNSRMFLAGRSMIPTHNSPTAAGIGLYGLLADRERGAQIYAAATTKDQADILFQDAVKMAQANPAIWKRLQPSGQKKVWNLRVKTGKQIHSFFRPVAKTVGKQGSGPRPHFALVDEVHEHPNRDVIEILERGFKFRRQPMLLMFTNSGSDRKSTCWEEREHAVKAANGDPAGDETFSYICALDDKDDPFEDPSCWKKANPLLGVILTHEYLAGVVEQAKSMPGRRNNVLRLHFCRWTDSDTAWVSRETWEACEDPVLRLEDFAERPCKAGLDLSSRKDLTARALVFEDGEVGDPSTGQTLKRYAAFVHGYTPEDTLRARARIDRAPYDVWVREGYLTATPGPVVRFPFIIQDLVADQDKFDLQEVAYDRYLITRFEEDMGDMGADLPLVEHPQGWNRRRDTRLWMPGSIEALEDLILQGRIRVHVNPALRSAVAGATFLTSPANLKRFDKASATQRIDMLIALVQAVGAWETPDNVEEPGESVYEQMARQRGALPDQPKDDSVRERRYIEDDEDADTWERS